MIEGDWSHSWVEDEVRGVRLVRRDCAVEIWSAQGVLVKRIVYAKARTAEFVVRHIGYALQHVPDVVGLEMADWDGMEWRAFHAFIVKLRARRSR